MSARGREAVLRRIADEILGAGAAGVTRVAIDGVDGAGKTTFADELGEALAFDLHADQSLEAAEEPAAADGILDNHVPEAAAIGAEAVGVMIANQWIGVRGLCS